MEDAAEEDNTGEPPGTGFVEMEFELDITSTVTSPRNVSSPVHNHYEINMINNALSTALSKLHEDAHIPRNVQVAEATRTHFHAGEGYISPRREASHQSTSTRTQFATTITTTTESRASSTQDPRHQKKGERESRHTQVTPSKTSVVEQRAIADAPRSRSSQGLSIEPSKDDAKKKTYLILLPKPKNMSLSDSDMELEDGGVQDIQGEPRQSDRDDSTTTGHQEKESTSPSSTSGIMLPRLYPDRSSRRRSLDGRKISESEIDLQGGQHRPLSLSRHATTQRGTMGGTMSSIEPARDITKKSHALGSPKDALSSEVSETQGSKISPDSRSVQSSSIVGTQDMSHTHMNFGRKHIVSTKDTGHHKRHLHATGVPQEIGDLQETSAQEPSDITTLSKTNQRDTAHVETVDSEVQEHFLSTGEMSDRAHSRVTAQVTCQTATQQGGEVAIAARTDVLVQKTESCGHLATMAFQSGTRITYAERKPSGRASYTPIDQEHEQQPAAAMSNQQELGGMSMMPRQIDASSHGSRITRSSTQIRPVQAADTLETAVNAVCDDDTPIPQASFQAGRVVSEGSVVNGMSRLPPSSDHGKSDQEKSAVVNLDDIVPISYGPQQAKTDTSPIPMPILEVDREGRQPRFSIAGLSITEAGLLKVSTSSFKSARQSITPVDSEVPQQAGIHGELIAQEKREIDHQPTGATIPPGYADELKAPQKRGNDPQPTGDTVAQSSEPNKQSDFGGDEILDGLTDRQIEVSSAAVEHPLDQHKEAQIAGEDHSGLDLAGDKGGLNSPSLNIVSNEIVPNQHEQVTAVKDRNDTAVEDAKRDTISRASTSTTTFNSRETTSSLEGEGSDKIIAEAITSTDMIDSVLTSHFVLVAMAQPPSYSGVMSTRETQVYETAIPSPTEPTIPSPRDDGSKSVSMTASPSSDRRTTSFSQGKSGTPESLPTSSLHAVSDEPTSPNSINLLAVETNEELATVGQNQVPNVTVTSLQSSENNCDLDILEHAQGDPTKDPLLTSGVLKGHTETETASSKVQMDREESTIQSCAIHVEQQRNGEVASFKQKVPEADKTDEGTPELRRANVTGEDSPKLHGAHLLVEDSPLRACSNETAKVNEDHQGDQTTCEQLTSNISQAQGAESPHTFSENMPSDQTKSQDSACAEQRHDEVAHFEQGDGVEKASKESDDESDEPSEGRKGEASACQVPGPCPFCFVKRLSKTIQRDIITSTARDTTIPSQHPDDKILDEPGNDEANTSRVALPSTLIPDNTAVSDDGLGALNSATVMSPQPTHVLPTTEQELPTQNQLDRQKSIEATAESIIRPFITEHASSSVSGAIQAQMRESDSPSDPSADKQELAAASQITEKRISMTTIKDTYKHDNLQGFIFMDSEDNSGTVIKSIVELSRRSSTQEIAPTTQPVANTTVGLPESVHSESDGDSITDHETSIHALEEQDERSDSSKKRESTTTITEALVDKKVPQTWLPGAMQTKSDGNPISAHTDGIQIHRLSSPLGEVPRVDPTGGNIQTTELAEALTSRTSDALDPTSIPGPFLSGVQSNEIKAITKGDSTKDIRIMTDSTQENKKEQIDKDDKVFDTGTPLSTRRTLSLATCVPILGSQEPGGVSTEACSNSSKTGEARTVTEESDTREVAPPNQTDPPPPMVSSTRSSILHSAVKTTDGAVHASSTNTQASAGSLNRERQPHEVNKELCCFPMTRRDHRTTMKDICVHDNQIASNVAKHPPNEDKTDEIGPRLTEEGEKTFFVSKEGAPVNKESEQNVLILGSQEPSGTSTAACCYSLAKGEARTMTKEGETTDARTMTKEGETTDATPPSQASTPAPVVPSVGLSIPDSRFDVKETDGAVDASPANTKASAVLTEQLQHHEVNQEVCCFPMHRRDHNTTMTEEGERNSFTSKAVAPEDHKTSEPSVPIPGSQELNEVSTKACCYPSARGEVGTQNREGETKEVAPSDEADTSALILSCTEPSIPDCAVRETDGVAHASPVNTLASAVLSGERQHHEVNQEICCFPVTRRDHRTTMTQEGERTSFASKASALIDKTNEPNVLIPGSQELNEDSTNAWCYPLARGEARTMTKQGDTSEAAPPNQADTPTPIMSSTRPSILDSEHGARGEAGTQHKQGETREVAPPNQADTSAPILSDTEPSIPDLAVRETDGAVDASPANTQASIFLSGERQQHEVNQEVCCFPMTRRDHMITMTEEGERTFLAIKGGAPAERTSEERVLIPGSQEPSRFRGTKACCYPSARGDARTMTTEGDTREAEPLDQTGTPAPIVSSRGLSVLGSTEKPNDGVGDTSPAYTQASVVLSEKRQHHVEVDKEVCCFPLTKRDRRTLMIEEEERRLSASKAGASVEKTNEPSVLIPGSREPSGISTETCCYPSATGETRTMTKEGDTIEAAPPDQADSPAPIMSSTRPSLPDSAVEAIDGVVDVSAANTKASPPLIGERPQQEVNKEVCCFPVTRNDHRTTIKDVCVHDYQTASNIIKHRPSEREKYEITARMTEEGEKKLLTSKEGAAVDKTSEQSAYTSNLPDSKVSDGGQYSGTWQKSNEEKNRQHTPPPLLSHNLKHPSNVAHNSNWQQNQMPTLAPVFTTEGGREGEAQHDPLHSLSFSVGPPNQGSAEIVAPPNQGSAEIAAVSNAFETQAAISGADVPGTPNSKNDRGAFCNPFTRKVGGQEGDAQPNPLHSLSSTGPPNPGSAETTFDTEAASPGADIPETQKDDRGACCNPFTRKEPKTAKERSAHENQMLPNLYTNQIPEVTAAPGMFSCESQGQAPVVTSGTQEVGPGGGVTSIGSVTSQGGGQSESPLHGQDEVKRPRRSFHVPRLSSCCLPVSLKGPLEATQAGNIQIDATPTVQSSITQPSGHDGAEKDDSAQKQNSFALQEHETMIARASVTTNEGVGEDGSEKTITSRFVLVALDDPNSMKKSRRTSVSESQEEGGSESSNKNFTNKTSRTPVIDTHEQEGIGSSIEKAQDKGQSGNEPELEAFRFKSDNGDIIASPEAPMESGGITYTEETPTLQIAPTISSLGPEPEPVPSPEEGKRRSLTTTIRSNCCPGNCQYIRKGLKRIKTKLQCCNAKTQPETDSKGLTAIEDSVQPSSPTDAQETNLTSPEEQKEPVLHDTLQEQPSLAESSTPAQEELQKSESSTPAQEELQKSIERIKEATLCRKRELARQKERKRIDKPEPDPYLEARLCSDRLRQRQKRRVAVADREAKRQFSQARTGYLDKTAEWEFEADNRASSSFFDAKSANERMRRRQLFLDSERVVNAFAGLREARDNLKATKRRAALRVLTDNTLAAKEAKQRAGRQQIRQKHAEILLDVDRRRHRIAWEARQAGLRLADRARHLETKKEEDRRLFLLDAIEILEAKTEKDNAGLEIWYENYKCGPEMPEGDGPEFNIDYFAETESEEDEEDNVSDNVSGASGPQALPDEQEVTTAPPPEITAVPP